MSWQDFFDGVFVGFSNNWGSVAAWFSALASFVAVKTALSLANKNNRPNLVSHGNISFIWDQVTNKNTPGFSIGIINNGAKTARINGLGITSGRMNWLGKPKKQAVYSGWPDSLGTDIPFQIEDGDEKMLFLETSVFERLVTEYVKTEDDLRGIKFSLICTGIKPATITIDKKTIARIREIFETSKKKGASKVVQAIDENKHVNQSDSIMSASISGLVDVLNKTLGFAALFSIAAAVLSYSFWVGVLGGLRIDWILAVLPMASLIYTTGILFLPGLISMLACFFCVRYIVEKYGVGSALINIRKLWATWVVVAVCAFSQSYFMLVSNGIIDTKFSYDYLIFNVEIFCFGALFPLWLLWLASDKRFGKVMTNSTAICVISIVLAICAYGTSAIGERVALSYLSARVHVSKEAFLDNPGILGARHVALTNSNEEWDVIFVTNTHYVLFNPSRKNLEESQVKIVKIEEVAKEKIGPKSK